MTDRKLLELAAKAAGIEVHWDATDTAWLKWPSFSWNPLTDDGDALRLATKLNLWEAVRDGFQHLDSDNAPYAATRRAIVRAAAQMQINKEVK
jgi:hypothetical protein